ncbi:MAG TPA: hypothetical protein PK747_01340 [Acidobacteriota bacterium]|nr:hypothetical protein [Acidobacteriota bacterium]HNT18250.1 hypothetical protein [Acidobacteriota bacterium]HQO19224.1 hypothetical protein [Acidobacteriota bacterium]HQQ46036.1 hypothetical protein [Acidobacteriota bacterium]
MEERRILAIAILFLFCAFVLMPAHTFAFLPKSGQSALEAIQFQDSRLGVHSEGTLAEDIYSIAGTTAYPNGTQVFQGWNKFVGENGSNWTLWIDKRSGIPSFCEGSGLPWVPGAGNSLVNNDISIYLNSQDGIDISTLEKIARNFIYQNSNLFPFDCDNLTLNPISSNSYDEYLWIASFDYVYRGIPVENARAYFRINSGNLVQFGTENISPIKIDPTPYYGATDAQQILGSYIGGFLPDDELLETGRLSIIPISPCADIGQYVGVVGSGVDYRLIYTLVFKRQNVLGTWLAKIDAHTGELLSFGDENLYGIVKGGIYPITRTDIEVTHPFPNLVLQMDDGTRPVTDRAGAYGLHSGTTATARLDWDGEEDYWGGISVVDHCGDGYTPADTKISAIIYPGNIDYGTSTGRDCDVPISKPLGDTHAARNAYFHLDSFQQKARAWLPLNVWLNSRVTANVNIQPDHSDPPPPNLPTIYCTAFWDGQFGTANYARTGGCSNPGEISSILIHEFGHGLDHNDGLIPPENGEKGTSEAYADVSAFFVTHDSCSGRNAFTINCDGYGVPCISCTGARDVDYAKRTPSQPHTPNGFIRGHCGLVPTGYGGPCGKEPHCESYILSEAVWDLATRKLAAGGIIDQHSAWEIAERLFFLSAPSRGQGFTCNTQNESNWTSHGCNGDSWYKAFLFVDDDNGNLTDGTPHSEAIYDAFNDHAIACAPRYPNHAICSLQKPTLTVTTSNYDVVLSWNSVPGASAYKVFRNEIGLNAGYIRMPITIPASTLQYQDYEVANGVTYYYTVQALSSGLNRNCKGPLATPKSVTPNFPYYSVSGYIGVNPVTPVSDVLVDADPAWGKSEGAGNYLISGLKGYGASYTVAPSKPCYVFTPSYSTITITNSNRIQNFLTYPSLTGCGQCYQKLEQDMGKCGGGGVFCPIEMQQYYLGLFRNCVHTQTQMWNSMINGAELLSINLSRAKGQPTTECFLFSVAEEDDYFVNLVNGDSVDKNTRVSSATVSLNPGDDIFKPSDFNMNARLLVKPVHLTVGDYSLEVELRSQPDSYLSIVISDRDFSQLPVLP